MDKKILINFFYNTGYQILNLVLPFITIPYISRVFSPNEIGIYGSSYSMVQLCNTLGMFALSSYGVNTIARVRDNKFELSKKYYQLRFLQKITVTISLLLYLLVVFNINDNRIIYFIQSIFLFASLLDISWLFMGVEDFKKTVVRNIFVKFISLLLLFIFVNDSNDLWKYTLILALSTLLGNWSMWIYKSKLILKNMDYKNEFKIHFFAAVSLLIPQICYQIYTLFDRTILSIVSSSQAVGNYDQSQKIIRISIGIVTSLGIVMLPRISYMLNNKFDEIKINETLRKSLNITLFLSVALSFGIFVISDNFVPWFFGDKFLDIILLLKVSSFICVFTAIGSFLSNQYAIPKDNKKAYIIPLVIAAILSIIFNLVLGFYFGALGACISILITEIIATILRLIFLRKDLNIRYLFNDLYKFIISGLVMLFIVQLLKIKLNLSPSFFSTCIEIVIGGVVYCLMLLIMNLNFALKKWPNTEIGS